MGIKIGIYSEFSQHFASSFLLFSSSFIQYFLLRSIIDDICDHSLFIKKLKHQSIYEFKGEKEEKFILEKEHKENTEKIDEHRILSIF